MDFCKHKHWELWNYTSKIAKICTYESVQKLNMMIKCPDTDVIDFSTLCQPFSASQLWKIFLLSRQKKKKIAINYQQKRKLGRVESCRQAEKGDQLVLLITQKEKTIQPLQVQYNGCSGSCMIDSISLQFQLILLPFGPEMCFLYLFSSPSSSQIIMTYQFQLHRDLWEPTVIFSKWNHSSLQICIQLYSGKMEGLF